MTFFKKLTINLNAEIHRWHKIKELKYLKSCGLRSPVCGWENREAGILNDSHYGVGSQSIWCRDRGLLVTPPLWLMEWPPRLLTHPFLGCQDILSPLRISVPHWASASTAAKGKSAISMKSMFQGQLIVTGAQKNPTETKLGHTPIISTLAFILKTSYMRLCVLF